MVYQLAEGVNLHVLPTKQYKTIRILSVLLRVATRSHHETFTSQQHVGNK